MIKLQENQQFTSQWFKGIVTVQSVDESKNNVEVYIDRGNGHGHSEEWNLEHTVWGFERGDYKIYRPGTENK